MPVPKNDRRTVIAIDPGTKCGWCILFADGRIESGTANLEAKRHESKGMRFIHAVKLIRSLIETAGTGAVLAYEEVLRHQGVDAAHVYGGIIAHIQAECINAGIEYFAIPVGTIKKRATGSGNAGKPAMIAAAAARWPGWSGDDNEADARWIAVVASETI
jgi:Holliday junction resolvasome RuvABC endonuclease subunit